MSARLSAILAVFALTLPLGACGFNPLYGEIGNKPGGQAIFGSIYVDTIAGERIGYDLRNNLISLLQGPTKTENAT